MAKTGGVTSAQLKSIIERVERIEEERRELGADVREIYAEAKGNGYEPKIIRKIIQLRKMNSSDRAEQEALMETYCNAIGMQYSLDLSAIDKTEGESAAAGTPARRISRKIPRRV